jgi:hypothetical protein
MTSEAAGASKRHDDHSAVGSLVERPVRPAAEARWYCLDRDGVAMLCKDEADARAQVIENDDCWPRRAPHRAALLGDVSAADAHIPMARLIELETAEHERDILLADNAKLHREAYTWSKAAEIYAASEAKLCEARLAELRHVAEAAQTMRTELAGSPRADALYDLREWALNRQRADVLNEGPNVGGKARA